MDKTQFGKLISELRKKQNMQQKELAEKMCLSPSTISKWESGKNLPDMITLKALAPILGVPLDTLIYPEKTLHKIEQRDTEMIPSIPSPEVPPLTTQLVSTNNNTINKISLIGYACALSLLIILIIFIVEIYQYHNPTFTVIQSRYQENPLNGPIYELAVVCPANVTQDALFEYTDAIHEEWIANEYAQDAKYILIYFYPDKDNALRWGQNITTITLVK